MSAIYLFCLALVFARSTSLGKIMKKLLMTLMANLMIATTCQAASVMIVNQGSNKVSCSGACAKFPKTIESSSAPSVQVEGSNWQVEYKDSHRRGCVFKKISTSEYTSVEAIQLSYKSSCSLQSGANGDDIVFIINTTAYGK